MYVVNTRLFFHTVAARDAMESGVGLVPLHDAVVTSVTQGCLTCAQALISPTLQRPPAAVRTPEYANFSLSERTNANRLAQLYCCCINRLAWGCGCRAGYLSRLLRQTPQGSLGGDARVT